MAKSGPKKFFLAKHVKTVLGTRKIKLDWTFLRWMDNYGIVHSTNKLWLIYIFLFYCLHWQNPISFSFSHNERQSSDLYQFLIWRQSSIFNTYEQFLTLIHKTLNKKFLEILKLKRFDILVISFKLEQPLLFSLFCNNFW